MVVIKATGVKWENASTSPNKSSSTPMPNQPPPIANSHSTTNGSHMLMPELSCGSVRVSPKNVTTIMRVV